MNSAEKKLGHSAATSSSGTPQLEPEIRTGGKDAVCFTAGFTGAMFGAGTIHAYLAADREPPAVVAGISTGAINAAAMQRCYQELQNSPRAGERREVLRWRWFRQYLSMLIDEPLSAIWRGLPRLTDFSADLPPVQDSSIGSFGTKDTNAYWVDQEKRARRELFLIMKLADWLARLPLKISLLATMLVNYVRLTERIPDWRGWRRIKYASGQVYIVLAIVAHTAFHPFWFKESRFKTTPKTEIRFYKPSYWLRPLLGWRIFFLAWTVLLIFAEGALAMALAFAKAGKPVHSVAALLMEVVGITALAIVYFERRPIQGYVWHRLLPLVANHFRRFAGILFLFGLEYALVKLNNAVLNLNVLDKPWVEAWDQMVILLGILCGLCLFVIFVFEIVSLAAIVWRWGRTKVGKCTHPVQWGLALALAEAFLVLAYAYLVKGVILKLLIVAAFAFGATALMLLAVLKTFPIVLRLSQKHMHPIVSLVLRTPWTTGLVVLQGVCLVSTIFEKYRPIAIFCLIALLCLESLAIAAGVILTSREPAEKRDPLLTKGPIKKRIVRWISTQIFRNLEMERAIVHKFQLLLRLTRLFGHDGESDRLDESPMPVLIVAAPLQTIGVGGSKRGVSQVWAKKGIRIVDALAAALALPGLYEPLHFDQKQFPKDAKDIAFWEMEHPPEILDLVDGAKVRENPLPALFQFLRKSGREPVAESLSSTPDDPRVHIVFTVPIGEHEGSLKPGPLGVNIVDVAFASMRLNQRRDSELEIEQTNFMSELEFSLRRLAGGKEVDRDRKQKLYPIFANAITPEDDLTFDNPLRPDAGEVLKHVASGCRRTLQTIYKKELREFHPESTETSCLAFLSQVTQARNSRPNLSNAPGLPEVCGACTCKLQKEKEPNVAAVNGAALDRFVHLNGTKPRIVFLASGGVFRGSFHAGMLACLLTTDIRPDVIVGASVGTLMGGVLGAMLTARNGQGMMDYSPSLKLLTDLVHVLLHVDKQIAFTKTLKTAARDFGIRARGIRLSPNQIRRMVKRGSRRDPGFAATGAPPALIDGLSNLLFIPHTTTAWIAAQFVAGHVTQATKKLLKQMKKETLRRLDVEYSLMGVSLLEPTAQRLLGSGYGIRLDVTQPFLPDKIAFFATTTNLLNETTFLLGRELIGEGESFDFVQGTLASSAFPTIFAPRRQSDIFPGTGRTDILFSDGGMFDNLPFIPTIELMGAVQLRHCSQHRDMDPIDFLARRHAAPDLFIAGSLNIPPEQDEYGDGDFDDLVTIHRRANSLQDNVKIRAFQETAETIHEEIDLLLKKVTGGIDLDEPTAKLINGIVEAEVLPVFPIDREHLNPTYAFCASVGLRKERVQRSIVNGCFQTFAALANAQMQDPPPDLRQAKRSIDVLVKPTELAEGGHLPPRVPVIAWRPKQKSRKKDRQQGLCPYFQHSRRPRKPRLPGAPWTDDATPEPQPFVCPFFQASIADLSAEGRKTDGQIEVGSLYDTCGADARQNEFYAENSDGASKASSTPLASADPAKTTPSLAAI
jgi:predicted acylesterase/phospholipase RssA